MGWSTEGDFKSEQTEGRMLDLCHCDLLSELKAQSVGVRYLEIKDMQFDDCNEYGSKAYETSGREHPGKKKEV